MSAGEAPWEENAQEDRQVLGSLTCLCLVLDKGRVPAGELAKGKPVKVAVV